VLLHMTMMDVRHSTAECMKYTCYVKEAAICMAPQCVCC
jgi:hypothetical protein